MLKIKIVILFLLLLQGFSVIGQFVPAEVVPVKEKTIINGKVYYIHTVQKGQTFYSICRAYNVSQDYVLKENPGVVPEALKEGSALIIPAGEEAGAGLQQPDMSQFYEHRVRRWQTVYSLARRYDVTEEMIYRYNPWAREGIKIDQILLIPKSGEMAPEPVTTTIDEQDAIPGPEVSETDSTCIAPEGEVYDVALLIPLFTDYFRALQSGNALSENTPSVQGQIPSLSREFAEFYEGFLLAADSMKKAGMKLNLHVFDTDRDNSKASGIRKSLSSLETDLIIGPVYTEQMNVINPSALEPDANVISPLSTNISLVNGNSRLFQVTPSKDAEATALAAYLSRLSSGRYILVRDSISMEDSWRFKNKMLQGPDTILREQPRLIEVTLNEVVNGDISKILSADEHNYIIVFSESEPDVGALVTRLYMETSEYDITLFGQPVWQIWKTLELTFLHKLELTLFTPFHVDYSRPEVKSFLKKCREVYGFEPYEISRSGYNFCMLGYDTGLYFLSALKDYGRDFQNCIENHRTATLLSDYTFMGGGGNGFVNGYINFVRYNQDYTIESIKLQPR